MVREYANDNKIWRNSSEIKPLFKLWKPLNSYNIKSFERMTVMTDVDVACEGICLPLSCCFDSAKRTHFALIHLM